MVFTSIDTNKFLCVKNETSQKGWDYAYYDSSVTSCDIRGGRGIETTAFE